jgi:hypothetical protein
MDRVFKYLWLIPLAIFCNRITSLLPEFKFVHPFPMFEIVDKFGRPEGITLQGYAFIFAMHAGWIILWVREILRKDKYSILFKWFLVIEVLSLFDFIIRYEQSFITIGFYPVEFTDIKLMAYVVCIALFKRKYYLKCKT